MASNTHKIKTNITTIGSITAGTTLTVVGATTLAATTTTSLSVSGSSAFPGGITGGISVAGNSTFANNVTVTGDLTVNGSFSFAGGSVFPDDTFAVQDNADSTKQVLMSVGGATTATSSTLTFAQTVDRVITFPDADISVVGEASTQSLTNKTIDADLNTISNIEDADIKSAADIARTKLASGAASHVLVNDGSGVMSSEAQLTPVRGGTGQDLSASTGVLIVTAGTVAASTIADANVDAAAAIARTKIANGTASHVVINDGSGTLSSEVSLAETRGGTAQTTYAAGDLLYAPTTNTLAKLPVGGAGQVLRTSNALLPVWEDAVSLSREYRIWDDFFGGISGGNHSWQNWQGGTGAGSTNSTATISATHPGVIRLTTGTSATGRAGYGLAPSANPLLNGVVLGTGVHVEEYMINVTQLSNITEEFRCVLGLQNISTTPSTNAVQFKYDRLAFGTNWQCESISASSTTRTDSGVAAGAGAWIKLRFQATSSQVEYYINDVLVATHSTTIPSTVVCSGFKIEKVAGVSATFMDVDYFAAYRRFATSR